MTKKHCAYALFERSKVTDVQYNANISVHQSVSEPRILQYYNTLELKRKGIGESTFGSVQAHTVISKLRYAAFNIPKFRSGEKKSHTILEDLAAHGTLISRPIT